MIMCEQAWWPRTEPWGTPYERGESGDLKLPMETNCLLSVRYDLLQDSGTPVKPCRVSNLVTGDFGKHYQRQL